MFKQLLLIILVIGIIISVVQCVDDSPTNNDADPSDTIALTIVATYPANTATLNSVEDSITVQFSKPINPSTLNSLSFLVNDNVTGTVSYNNITYEAVFHPDTTLEFDSSYSVTITTAVQDTVGDSLQSEFSWSFSAPSSTQAYLILSPERLPSNPSGTDYELWVTSNSESDTISLGKFKYDFDLKQFLTVDGAVRADGSKFLLDDNVDNYHKILLSVEPSVGDVVNSPSSIMLIDLIDSSSIRLTIPLSDELYNSIIRYNMKSPSDGIGSENDGRSIWFSNYIEISKEIIDTTNLISWYLDSGIYVDSYDPSINLRGLDTSSIYFKDTNVVIGLDTVIQKVVRFDTIISYDTINYWPTNLRVSYETSSYEIIYEWFFQDVFGLPSLQEYGWKYRGWVVSSAIDPSAIGEITTPAWGLLDQVLPEIQGGLLTTGAFYNIDQVDLENPFVDITFRNPPRIPPFPGEDFILNLPSPLTSIPNLAGTNGHVFITLEPEFYTDSTNFPLILFVGNLPERSGDASTPHQMYTLSGYTYSSSPVIGVPIILVTIEKH